MATDMESPKVPLALPPAPEPAKRDRLAKLRMRFRFWRQRRMHRFFGSIFMLSLSTLGVVLSIYGSILTDAHLQDWWSLLWNDREAREMKLSMAMAPVRSTAADGAGSNQGSQDLYVFALDVSGSMDKEQLGEAEWNSFKDKLKASGLEIPEECVPSPTDLKRWHLARAEICAFLGHVPEGAYASLWKFASSPKMVTEKNARFERNLENLQVEQLKNFRSKLAGPDFAPDPNDLDVQNTDFESLLTSLYDTYVQDQNWREVHFFIVSDFIHDIGKKSAYDFSVERIAEKFSDIGKVGNTMFHLGVIGDPQHQVNSIIRVAESTVEWFQCRVHNIEGDRTNGHDFFNTFEPSNEKLIFYYVNNTSRIAPIKLLADQESHYSSRILLGLMRDLKQGASKDLTMQISTAWNEVECAAPRGFGLIRQTPLDEGHLPDILRPGSSRLVTIQRKDDYICLQPESVIDDGAGYKLTIAGVGGDTDRRTYTVDIEFQRVLPPLAGLTILFSAAILLASGGMILVWVLTFLWSHLKA